MNTFIYIAIVFIVFVCFINSTIEGYDYPTKFTQNDLQFIPYSDSSNTNTLNNYVIRAVIPKNPYLLSSILDSNTSYQTHSVFEFPTNDPRKSIHNPHFDIEKNYRQQFRPIITHNKNREELYNNEIVLDKTRINDPFEVEMDPKYLDSDIQYKPRDVYNSLNSKFTDPIQRHVPRAGTQLETYDYNKYGHRFKCPWGFTLNKKKRHQLRHKNYKDAVADACVLL